MSKIKIVIIVVLLVGGGGAGAIFGLNSFYMTQIQNQIEARLGGADKGLVDFLRMRAFEEIEKLSRECKNENLATPLAQAPASTANLSPEALQNVLKSSHERLVPVLENLQKKLKTANLSVLSLEGRVLAKLPDQSKYGESLKGLPIVTECLSGVSRDGFYELNKGQPPFAMAATPILNTRGNVSGCLLSMNAFGTDILKEYTARSGLQAAIFLRKQTVTSTVSAKALKPLLSQLDSSDIVRFADPSAAAPLFISPKDTGFAARPVQLPSSTDGLHASAILPLADMLTPFAKAQQTLFIGIGALLVFGLLIGLLLCGKPATGKEAERLRDAITMLADGSASTLGVESYSGVYRDLAGNIAKLFTSGTRAPAAISPESVSDILGKPTEPTPTDAGASGTLDFESLLAGEKQPEPKEAVPPANPEPTEGHHTLEGIGPLKNAANRGSEAAPLGKPEEAPQLEAPKEEPALSLSPEPSPAAHPPADGGPRVNVPSDLAGIFDDQDATREVEPAILAQARPTPPPATPAIPSLDESIENEQITSSDYKPDATVIAQVPDELLLKLSTNAAEAETAAAKPSIIPKPPAPVMPATPVMPPPPAKPAGEEAHFKEVFDQFVGTKKQCGEPTAGLTFDRFAQKLRKNTADLKVRYKCRSVKFQVYVKNGKAALRATPVK
jgi:hypothetical protein